MCWQLSFYSFLSLFFSFSFSSFLLSFYSFLHLPSR